MSFGFSVGDILLVSQLAYRLYGALSSSRRPAGKEFENAVFGLRCALDHLSRQANDISATAAHNGGQEAADMRKNLDIMIQSCGTTLMELNNILLNYADDANEQQTGAQPMSSKPKKLSVSQVKRTVKINWLKVRWDLEGQNLIAYREKLQTHTDAINVVLNTFLWSASHRIEMAGNVNAEQMQRLHDQGVQSNAALCKLTEDMRLLLSKTRNPVRTPAALRTVEPSLPGTHRGGSGLMSMVALPTSAPLTTTAQPPHLAPSEISVRRRVQAERLPPAIIQLNKERSATGFREYARFGEHNLGTSQRPDPPSKPSEELFFGAEQPTVAQIQAELENLTLSAAASRTISSDGNNILLQRIHRWLQALEGTVDSWIRVSVITKEDKQTRQHYTLKLMLTLNSNLARMDEPTRMTMYAAMNYGGINRIFEKLRDCLSSVMVEKEMETFEDERDSCLM